MSYLSGYIRFSGALNDLENDRSDMERLTRQLFLENRKKLDLLAERPPSSAFAPAVHRLFGDNPAREKSVRIGNHKFAYFGLVKGAASFLPALWRENLDQVKGTWPGCENWWAGYPLIVWMELRSGDNGTDGYLRLNAEVGPISDHTIRKGVIQAIKAGASAKGMQRIQFEANASDKGRLYSRFLRENSINLKDTSDAAEMEGKLIELIADFHLEFTTVAGVIPLLPRADGRI